MSNLPPQDFCKEGEKKDALKVGFTTQASTVFELVILTKSLWTLGIDTMQPGKLCDVTASHGSMNTLYYRNFAADSKTLTFGYIWAENSVAWDLCPFPEHTTGHLRKALKGRVSNS